MSRHPASDRFHELLRESGEMHDRKQADYGSDSDPFANVRASQEFGVDPWVGALLRLNDKVVRLKSMIRNGNLRNESAEDSMRDIAVYALIALVLYEQQQSEKSDPTLMLFDPEPYTETIVFDRDSRDDDDILVGDRVVITTGPFVSYFNGAEGVVTAIDKQSQWPYQVALDMVETGFGVQKITHWERHEIERVLSNQERDEIESVLR